MDLAVYKSSYVTELEDISCCCLICQQSIPFTQKTMEAHLKKDHRMELTAYELVRGFINDVTQIQAFLTPSLRVPEPYS